MEVDEEIFDGRERGVVRDEIAGQGGMRQRDRARENRLM